MRLRLVVWWRRQRAFYVLSAEVELDLLNEVVGEPESLFAAQERLLSVL